MILMASIFLISSLISSVLVGVSSRQKNLPQGSLPRNGGVALWMSFVFVSLAFLVFSAPEPFLMRRILFIFALLSIMIIVGFIDDKKELSVSAQFLAQTAIAASVIFLGVRTEIAGIGFWGNSVLTFLWIVGITNAFNHLDILDGLAGAIALICSLAFSFVAWVTGNGFLSIIFLVLAGSLLGFLRHNFPAAKIYMGNTGSHFIGFALSVFSILISYATLKNRMALLVPIVILGVPIFDTLFVMWMRTLKRKYFWEKSDDHIAFRLMASGFSKKKTVAFMVLFTVIFCACGVVLLAVSVAMSLGVISLLLLLSAVLTAHLKQIPIKS